ncbi:hypothetical protein N657DRAFT_43028 [Parathielavia appendiculata]|uniref:Uncharacterized protein n=1 Tax=Parathielavia appendiculata TaxID=2587402 RepID=A0AAN6Z938_9PEZI|nr:hypothetical protein N657DRAFT_43028 [Parathielavia appendiculata]
MARRASTLAATPAAGVERCTTTFLGPCPPWHLRLVSRWGPRSRTLLRGETCRVAASFLMAPIIVLLDPPCLPVRANSRDQPLSIDGRMHMHALWAAKWANIPKWAKHRNRSFSPQCSKIETGNRWHASLVAGSTARWDISLIICPLLGLTLFSPPRAGPETRLKIQVSSSPVNSPSTLSISLSFNYTYYLRRPTRSTGIDPAAFDHRSTLQIPDSKQDLLGYPVIHSRHYSNLIISTTI